jgi:hypothetical protein
VEILWNEDFAGIWAVFGFATSCELRALSFELRVPGDPPDLTLYFYYRKPSQKTCSHFCTG